MPASAGTRSSPAVSLAASLAVVERALSAHALRLALLDAARRLLAVGAIVAAAPLLVIVADHNLGGLPRLALALLRHAWLWGAAAGFVWALLVTLRTRFNPAYVAQDLDRALGAGHSTLLDIVLLGRSAGRDDVVAALAPGAAALVLDRRPASNAAAGLRGVGRLALAAPAAWLLYAWVSPKSVPDSWARLLGAELAPPTATRIALLRPAPTDAVFAGEALTLEFGVRGPLSEPLVVQVSWALRGATTVLELTAPPEPGEPGRRRLTLAPHETAGPLRYVARMGDARLEGAIDVRTPPRIDSVRLRVTPPLYAGAPYELEAPPELTLLSGATVVVTAGANCEMRDPVLVFRSNVESRRRMGAGAQRPRQAVATFSFEQDGEYVIEFRDPLGKAGRSAPRRVRVLADAPPVVQYDEPDAEREIDLRAAAWLRLRATDDVRLSSVTLVSERAGEAPRRFDLPLPEAGAQRLEVAAPLAQFDVREGERVRLWVEARDNRRLADGAPAPQATRGRTLTLTRGAEEGPPGPGTGTQPGSGAQDAPELEQRLREMIVQRAAQTGGQAVVVPRRAGEGAAGPGASAGAGLVALVQTDSPDSTSDGTRETGDSSAGAVEKGESVEEDGRRFLARHADALRALVEKRAAQMGAGSGGGEGPGAPGDETAGAPAPERSEPNAPLAPATNVAVATTEARALGTDADREEATRDKQAQGRENLREVEAEPDTRPQTKPSAAGEPVRAGPQAPGPSRPDVAAGAESQPAAQSRASQGFLDYGPATEAPADDAAAPGAPRALSPAGAARTLLDRLRDIGPIDASDLVALGYSETQAGGFVSDLQRWVEQARLAGMPLEPADWAAPAAPGALGSGMDVRAALALGGALAAPAGGRWFGRRVVPPDEQTVAADLREILDAYYESIASAARSSGAATERQSSERSDPHNSESEP